MPGQFVYIPRLLQTFQAIYEVRGSLRSFIAGCRACHCVCPHYTIMYTSLLTKLHGVLEVVNFSHEALKHGPDGVARS
jgi:hypothetical protein